MYAKRGDVAACRVFLYRVVLEERPSVRVLASAVDDCSRTLGRSSSITRYKQHDMLPHHHS